MGPVFWETLYISGRLPQVLFERYRAGGDIPKFLNRHPGEVSAAVAEIVQAKQARGRSNTNTHTHTHTVYNPLFLQ
jgi:hypothetical protein